MIAEARDEWRFLWRWMGISLLLHLVTAYFSTGYHSADEQFQVLEFLSYKLGGAPRSTLAVEFGERMRPWMQPAIYYSMTRFWQSIGVTSPFSWALSFRVFASLIGWLSTVGLALCTRVWFDDQALKFRRLAIMALALIWYFPALHARPSSESLGGSAFLVGLSLISLTLAYGQRLSRIPRTSAWFFAGAFLGLGFEARFQMGVMIVGLLAWLFARPEPAPQKEATRFQVWDFALLATGFLAIFGLGRWVDHWAYGDWSFSPWNYFSYNLVRGEVSRFGRAPWWDLFRMSFTESWPFLGLFLVIITLVAWVRRPRHILTWSMVPFFLVHEIIAHKELRFFFPIALAGPIFLAMGLARTNFRANHGWPSRLGKWGWRFLLMNNFVALVALMFLPFARTVQFYEGVYNALEREPKPSLADTQSFELYTQGRDPYEILGTPIYFYRPPKLRIRHFTAYSELAEALEKRKVPLWLFSPRFYLEPEAASLLPSCRLEFQTLPHWVTRINFSNWLERANVWSLYHCKPSKPGEPASN